MPKKLWTTESDYALIHMSDDQEIEEDQMEGEDLIDEDVDPDDIVESEMVDKYD